jgi:cytochrome c oxidase cbb3-type subunit 3
MTDFWSSYIVIIVMINILGCLWLLAWTRKRREGDTADDETTGHSYDGIEELNTPIPQWWLTLFYGTIVFAGIYLVLYPGLGKYKGAFNWTSDGQWELEVAKANNRYNHIYQELAKKPIEELARDPEALQMGQRIFANNCALCHGSDARGSLGYPNLTDDDWLYGATPDQLLQSITNGRNGMMPPMETAVGGKQGGQDVAAYVLSLSGRKGAGNATAGEKKFKTVCAVCHGPDGKGIQRLGAPNLTDNIWLHGGSEATIEQTIMFGRHGNMPAFKDQLSKAKIHILAAYEYSLSLKQK